MTDATALLIAAARAAAVQAYAPYSNFAVGAAIRLIDGQIVTGANVENASYGLSLCAETVAIAKVANDGRLADVVEIAVIGLASAAPIYPCGRCRQILNEAAALGGRDLVIHCAGADGTAVERHTLSALLPFAFGPDALGQPNTSGA
jgi:cytidine deaminase